MITIIIPTLNEEKYIGRLLKSLSTYPSIKQILIIDANSEDKTRKIINNFKRKIAPDNLQISIKENPKVLQGYALNIGIEEAKYKCIIRLDAHALLKKYDYKNDHFFNIKKMLEKKSICSVGFKQRFMFNNIFQASLSILATTPFLSKSKYRYVVSPTLTTDTAWLFAIKKDIAIQVGLFNPEATPNEDYEFNQRLIQKTSKKIMIYTPLPLYYSPRNNIIKLSIQYIKYGLARIETQKKLKKIKSKQLKFLNFLFLNLIMLLSLFFLLNILSNQLLYFFLLLIINLLYFIQYKKDKLIFSRNLSTVKQKIYLLLGSLISPFLTPIPLLFRSLGMILRIFK